jgi:hypothetical protein
MALFEYLAMIKGYNQQDFNSTIPVLVLDTTAKLNCWFLP